VCDRIALLYQRSSFSMTMWHRHAALFLTGLAVARCSEEKACAGDDCDIDEVGDVVLLQQSLGVEREVNAASKKSSSKSWVGEFPIFEPEAVQFVLHLTRYPTYNGQFYPQAHMAIVGRGAGPLAEQIFEWEMEDIDPMCSKGRDPTVAHSCGVLIHDHSVCQEANTNSVMFDAGPYEAHRAGHNFWASSLKGKTVVTGRSNHDLLGKAVTVHNRQGDFMACGSIGPMGLKINDMVPFYNYHGPSVVEGSVLLNAVRGANYAAKQVVRYKFSNVDLRCHKGGAADVANSCGVSIYTGKSCSEDPGQHFWNVSYYNDDPWTPVDYATINGLIGVGTVQRTAEVLTGLDMSELIGRALVVHDFNGQGIACGILVPETTVANGFVQPVGYTGTKQVSGWVKARIALDDKADSLAMSWTLHGVDERCADASTFHVLPQGACAVRIHSGIDCAAESPNLLLDAPLYEATGTTTEGLKDGVGKGVQVSDIVGRTVLITDADAQAIACGILNIADVENPRHY